MKNDLDFSPKELRMTILEMAYSGQSAHIACAFSIVEILSTLYRYYLNYPNNDPESKERDYLILSKGHGVMCQYACMNKLGWITSHQIKNYFADGSELKGLSDSRVKGLEVTSGSLGHGLSVGVGLSLATKMIKSSQKTFIIVGDGELNEGSIWEGLLFASHHDLNNLLVIVDNNKFQAMGTINEVLTLKDIKKKFISFGFDVLSVNGHDTEELKNGIDNLINIPGTKPKAIIADTIKGKGVDFMEANNEWHYKRLNKTTFSKAKLFLESS